MKVIQLYLPNKTACQKGWVQSVLYMSSFCTLPLYRAVFRSSYCTLYFRQLNLILGLFHLTVLPVSGFFYTVYIHTEEIFLPTFTQCRRGKEYKDILHRKMIVCLHVKSLKSISKTALALYFSAFSDLKIKVVLT